MIGLRDLRPTEFLNKLQLRPSGPRGSSVVQRERASRHIGCAARLGVLLQYAGSHQVYQQMGREDPCQTTVKRCEMRRGTLEFVWLSLNYVYAFL